MWKMFAFTAVAGTLCAAPLELGMGMNGDVRVGDTGARLALAIHHAGWSGTSKGARRDFAFPDAATGTATSSGISTPSASCKVPSRTSASTQVSG